MDIIKIRFGKRFQDIHEHIQRLMDEMLSINRPFLTTNTSSWLPDADIYETDREYIIVLNLAGVRKEDIEVFLYEDYLYIRGIRYQPIKTTDVIRYHQLELPYGRFERAFRIPLSVDKNSIEAIWMDGLLMIRMRKQAPVSRNIRVEVR